MKADYINDVEKVLCSEETICATVKGLGDTISADYKDKDLVLVGLLKGSVVFVSDLMRAIKIPCDIDFMDVSSYGASTVSSGVVNIIKDLNDSIEGRDVLIVEDIIDSGNTLYNLKKMLISRTPASVNIVTLLDKPARREAPIEPEYKGFVIEDEFVIGYGLDYAEEYRNLPYVGVLKRSVYEN